MPRKPCLTEEEQQFILQNHTVPANELAKKLGRDPRPIKKFLRKNCMLPPTPNIDIFPASQGMISDLQKSSEWKQLSLEFNADELQMFATSYASYMNQFTKQQDSILATERTQIMLAVKLEILMHRILKDRNEAQNESQKAKMLLDSLYTTIRNGKATKDDHVTVRTLEEKLVALDMSKKSFAIEYNHNMEKHKDIMRELKATRDQRIKSIENSKVSFLDLLKSLQDDDFREKQGRYAELMKKASDEALKRLGGTHRFADGKLDRPVITAETIEFSDDE